MSLIPGCARRFGHAAIEDGAVMDGVAVYRRALFAGGLACLMSICGIPGLPAHAELVEPPDNPVQVSTPKETRPQSQPQARPRDPLAQARSLFSSGKYEPAEKAARSALERDPRDWKAWGILGNCRYKLGDPKGALEAYDQSLQINPGNAQLQSWVGDLRGDLSSPELTPRMEAYLSGLYASAKSLENAGSRKTALKKYQAIDAIRRGYGDTAARINALTAAGEYAEASALAGKGDWNAAHALFAGIGDYLPGYMDADERAAKCLAARLDQLYRRGTAKEAAGRLKEALDDYALISAKDPAFRDVGDRMARLQAAAQSQADWTRAHQLLAAGSWEEAYPIFKRFGEASPSDENVAKGMKACLDGLYGRAVGHESGGNYREALTWYAKVQSLDPGYADVEARVAAIRGRYEVKSILVAYIPTVNQMSLNELLKRLCEDYMEADQQAQAQKRGDSRTVVVDEFVNGAGERIAASLRDGLASLPGMEMVDNSGYSSEMEAIGGAKNRYSAVAIVSNAGGRIKEVSNQYQGTDKMEPYEMRQSATSLTCNIRLIRISDNKVFAEQTCSGGKEIVWWEYQPRPRPVQNPDPLKAMLGTMLVGVGSLLGGISPQRPFSNDELIGKAAGELTAQMVNMSRSALSSAGPN